MNHISLIGYLLALALFLTSCHRPAASSRQWADTGYSGQTWKQIGKIWRMDRNGELGFRKNLAPILIEKGILDNLNRRQIKTFLGAPDRSESHHFFYYAENRDLSITFLPPFPHRTFLIDFRAHLNYTPGPDRFSTQQTAQLWDHLSKIWLAPEVDNTLRLALIMALESHSQGFHSLEANPSFIEEKLGPPTSQRKLEAGIAYYYDLTLPTETAITSRHAFFWFDSAETLQRIAPVSKIEGGDGTLCPVGLTPDK